MFAKDPPVQDQVVSQVTCERPDVGNAATDLRAKKKNAVRVLEIEGCIRELRLLRSVGRWGQANERARDGCKQQVRGFGNQECRGESPKCAPR